MEILSRRDHSEAELAQKMRSKSFTPSQIELTIAKLKQSNLLNDTTFANRYAQQILRSKAVGPRYVADKLRQKRIDNTIIEQVISDTYQEGEEGLAKKAADKWKKLHPKKAGDKQRLQKFLASRGFTQSGIMGVLE